MSSKNLKSKVNPLIEKNKVSNNRLVKMLMKRQISRKELYSMGVTEFQLHQLKNNYNLFCHYDPNCKNFVYYILGKGEDPFVFLPDNGEKKLKVVKMGDTHLGSSATDEEEVRETLSYLWKSGYRIILMVGDLIDGTKVYRGHDENVMYSTISRQVDSAVSVLSEFDFLYIANKGNHDAAATKNGGADAIALIQEKMINLGKEFVYLPAYGAYVVYKGVAIKLLHMHGGNSMQSDTYANQKVLDASFKTAYKSKEDVNCTPIFGKMVPVINLITGHYHTLAKFSYGSTLAESPLTSQHTTDLVGRMGVVSKTGVRVSEMTIKNGKLISEKGAIILGEDVPVIYELEQYDELERESLNPEISPRIKNHALTGKEETNLEDEQMYKIVRQLKKSGFENIDDLGITKNDIEYINNKTNLNLHLVGNIVVYQQGNEEHTIIYSTAQKKGMVSYLEISNMLIGSEFFSEKAFRYMLDITRKRGIKHVHIGGNAVWGIPSMANAKFTRLFEPVEQADLLIKILADYPEFHYFSINGVCENTFIESNNLVTQFDPMRYVEAEMQAREIKFTAVNSDMCDFLIFGTVFRMVNDKKNMKHPYTRDYDIVKAMRNLFQKSGERPKINGRRYKIGHIFFGYVPTTYESIFGGIYVTSTAGPTVDPDNKSIMIMSNPECAIVKALVNDGKIMKFEREIILPDV